MKTVSANWQTNITSPSRKILSKAEVYSGETLLYTLLPTDYIQSVNIESTPNNSKFFGYTVCQKATLVLLDKDDELAFAIGQRVKIQLGTTNSAGTQDEYLNYPNFYIDEISIDDVSKTKTITAYDTINESMNHTYAELTVTYPTTIKDFADVVGAYLGKTVSWSSTPQTITLSEIPNLDGKETLRSLLEAIAEVTGTICFMNNADEIHFVSLSSATTDVAISRSELFSVKIGESVTLSKIMATTELGDNVFVGDDTGKAQIIKDNPFLYDRTDIGTILTNILSAITFIPYDLKWRGNPAIEVGDYVSIALDDGTTAHMHYLGEKITYDGGMSATSVWSFEEASDKPQANTISEFISETTAKVDKVNRQIELKASEIKETTDALTERISTVEQAAILTLTPEAITAQIQEGIQGIDGITTTSGVFDKNGLTITRTEGSTTSDIQTNINYNGLTVTQDSSEVLKCSNTGVDATRLRARTYLEIDDSARFEESSFGVSLFWIGG